MALLFFAIRLAPFGKQLFVLLALLPMTMFELASVSCDALTISGAIFFTALLLWASKRATLRRVDVALVLVASALLLNVKPGYWALVLLVLLIRPAQLGGRTRYMAFVAGHALVVVGVFLIVSWLTAADARVQAVGGPQAQLLFVMREPLGFIGILWSNLQNNLRSWVLESIGVLGWLTITLPPASYFVVLVGGLGFFVRMREEVALRPWERALLAVVGVAVFVTVALALYAFVEPTADGQIALQGRYLAPVWLLLLLSVYGIKFARRQLGRLFLVGVLVVMMLQNFQTLILAYYP
jgi:Predicted membrane protein